MELRHLRYFVTVAEERSFSRAAELLGMAQPPLSQQIIRFERELGVRLFERSVRGVALTRAGETLLTHARGVLRAAHVAVREVQATDSGQAGRLTLAFMQSAAYEVLPGLLRTSLAALPELDLDIREMPIADQLTALLDGQIDLGILRPPVADDRLEGLCLLREAFLVAVPHEHALSGRRTICIRDLQGHPFVTFPHGHRAGFRERIDEALRSEGVTALRVREATHIHTICGLVAGGVGVALVPASARVLRLNGVRFVRLTDQPLFAETWLAWRRGALPAPVNGFLDLARSAVVRGARRIQ